MLRAPLQRTIQNGQNAEELANEVEALVTMLKETMEGVREGTEHIESLADLSEDARSRLDRERTKKPKLSVKGIDELIK